MLRSNSQLQMPWTTINIITSMLRSQGHIYRSSSCEGKLVIH